MTVDDDAGTGESARGPIGWVDALAGLLIDRLCLVASATALVLALVVTVTVRIADRLRK